MPAPMCPDCNTVMGMVQTGLDHKGYAYHIYRCNKCGYEKPTYPIDNYKTTRDRRSKRKL